jgi:regulator of nucleoside diphosphate kinase
MTGPDEQGLGHERRSVTIRRSDADVLHAVAMRTLLSAPRAAGALLDELHRAEIQTDETVPDDVVGLGAWVTFRRGGEPTAKPQRVQLVPPEEADLVGCRLSVLSSLGAGLIGLRTGQSIDWPDRLGGAELLTVIEVRWSAERRLDMGSDEERDRTAPPGEETPRRPSPQDAAPTGPKVLPFPARRSRREAVEDDWPPGAA